MALVSMDKLLLDARNKRIGVGAFNVGNMEMIIGTIKAAENLNTPIIMQIAEVRLKHSPLYLMGPMMVEAAKRAKVDVAVHFDHGTTMEAINQAIDFGFTSVMIDGSKYELDENIRLTKEVVSLAHKRGVKVEAELGKVGGSEGGTEDVKAFCTVPDEAKVFCEKTSVDALAVAIGNAHGFYKEEPKLQFDILDQIRNIVDTPLVLHGGSGISDADFQKSIDLGITKVNIATANLQGMCNGAEQYLRTEGSHNFFDLNEAMVKGVYENVTHHIKVFSKMQ